MKRISAIGASVVVVLAMSAIGAASASANPPEFGRCLKVKPVKTGVYGNAGCTTTGGTKANEYEWYPGFGEQQPIVKPGFTITNKAGTVLSFETIAARKITCTGVAGSGEISSELEVFSSLTFSGCSSGGAACQSNGAAAGTIVPGSETVPLGFINEPLHKVGGLYAFGRFGVFFTCDGGSYPTGEHFVFDGAVAPLSSGKMLVSETIKFAERKGLQKPEGFESARYNFYICEGEESKGGNAAENCEGAGLSATLIQKYEEKVEINPVV